MSKRAFGWDLAADAAENARRQLPPLAREYFEAGRKLLAGKPTPASLHGFRLATKRLRYTLELFRPCYGGQGMERRLADMRRIQQYLGEINDCAVVLRLVKDELPANSPQRKKVETWLRARARRQTAEFRRYWQEQFDAPGQERRWLHYLTLG